MAKRRILIADTSPAMRAWLCGALKPLDLAVRQVADGWELLAALADGGPFDLVVAQGALPFPNAFQALAMARTARDNTPFLLLSPVPKDRARSLVERVGRAALVEEVLDANVCLAAARRLLAIGPASGDESGARKPDETAARGLALSLRSATADPPSS